MKRFEAQKAYLVFMLILTVLIILPGCSGEFGGGHWNDPGTVTVTSTVPVNGDTGVATGNKLTATFSRAMAPSTINGTTFTLTFIVIDPITLIPRTTAVSGKVTYSGVTAVFTPAANLTTSTTYTATITTGARDLAGDALAANFTWSFTTGLTTDTTAPTLISTAPFNGELGVPINRNSTATFSEPMDPATLNSPATSFTVTETVSGKPVAGVVTYLGNTATFHPAGNLLPSTQYTSAISTTVAKDLGGIPLASGGLIPNPWSWTTGATADTIAPTITNTNPADKAPIVPVEIIINATFSEAMSQDTMITTNFTVKETVSGNNVQGTVAYVAQSNTAFFSPLSNLKPDTGYTVTVTSGAKDLAGNALVVPAVGGLLKPNPWTFRTAPAAAPGSPLAINLGRAASFGIASQAGLTTTGVTVVNGNIALYPLATCTDATGNAGASQTCLDNSYASPTGMTVIGSIFWAGDPFDNGGTALSVTNDLHTAWIEGKAKVPTRPTVAGDQLSSLIPYLPGVYHNATLGLAAGGTATLDAQNDANAIFIFQVDSSFVDSGTLLLPSKIVLLNGALARNVWFVTGLDITIGSGTTWNGNILAGRTAVVNNGSTVLGRVLAGASGAGAFTLTGAAAPSVTTITVPQ